MRYLLTGGGTGGHVYPALAIADEIRREQEDGSFLYVGVRGRLESRVVPTRGYPLRYVRSRPFPRSLSPVALAIFGLTLGWGILTAAFILLRYRPHVIVCTGGYVGAPVMFACGLLRKVGLCRAKVLVYEPNAHPGLLNQAVGRVADRIGVAFEQAGRWFDMKRVAVVGFPVRRELLEVTREEARDRLQIPAACLVVFAFGGSGGSRVINEALVDALPRLRDRQDLMIIHVTGRREDPEYHAVTDTQAHLDRLGIRGDTSSWYRRQDYMDDIEYGYAAADLVICRGGACTLTEVALCGLPSIVVPLSTAAEDHQAANARELERQGAGRVLYEEAQWRDGTVVSCVGGARLAKAVTHLLDRPEERRQVSETARAIPMRNSLELIVREIADLVAGHRPAPLNLEFPARPQEVPSDPNALLRRVVARLQEADGIAGLEPGELAYLRYQADRYLVSTEWYEVPLGRRNVGIKLIGHLQYRDRLDVALGILADRHPATPLRRLARGDFQHPGILRRNVVEYPIHMLGCLHEPVLEALLTGLDEDPYFEVRAAAARVLGEHGQGLAGSAERLEQCVLKALDDRAPSVVLQAIEALGRLGTSADVVAHLRRFYLHMDWQYRQAVVVALRSLVERGVVRGEELGDDVAQILATSPSFQPSFPLSDSLRELARLVHEPPGQQRGGHQ